VAKFYRLSVLDNVPGVSAIRLSSDPTHDLIRPNPAREDDASSVDTESVESVLSEDGIVNKIRQGIWSLFWIILMGDTVPKKMDRFIFYYFLYLD